MHIYLTICLNIPKTEKEEQKNQDTTQREDAVV